MIACSGLVLTIITVKSPTEQGVLGGHGLWSVWVRSTPIFLLQLIQPWVIQLYSNKKSTKMIYHGNNWIMLVVPSSKAFILGGNKRGRTRHPPVSAKRSTITFLPHDFHSWCLFFKLLIAWTLFLTTKLSGFKKTTTSNDPKWLIIDQELLQWTKQIWCCWKNN